jgi:hypothetical protein
VNLSGTFITTFFLATLWIIYVEGGGNCTREPDSTTTSGNYTCANDTCSWSEMGRADAALTELVGNWHRLTPFVRERIIELVRSCQP